MESLEDGKIPRTGGIYLHMLINVDNSEIYLIINKFSTICRMKKFRRKEIMKDYLIDK